jgi:xanthosine utilization system XapX-like protein
MDRFILLMLAGILAGFALLRVPLAGPYLGVLEPIIDLLGILAILVFSLVLLYKGVKALFGKN